MSLGERIIQEIDQLPTDEKRKVLVKIKEKFFQSPTSGFVVRENYR